MFSKVLNSIVLLAKQFITRQRAQERAVNVSLFRSCVRNEFHMERIKQQCGIEIWKGWNQGCGVGVGVGFGVAGVVATIRESDSESESIKLP